MNIDEPYPQKYINIDKKLRATPELKPEPTEDQLFIQAKKRIVEPMNVDEPHPQTYLEVHKVLGTTPELNPDEIEDPVFIAADRHNKEVVTPKQSIVPEINEQTLIEKEASAAENNNQQLLESAKALASAMKKMLEAAEPTHIKPQQHSKEFARAASLVTHVNQELAKVKHVATIPHPKTKNVISNESLLEATETLIKSIEIFRDAIQQVPMPTPQNELSDQPKPELPANKKE
jgi:hypothetical protein